MGYRTFYQRNGRTFSQWQYVGRRLRLACCDCGLVHTFQFGFKVDGSLMMRCRVNKKATKKRRASGRFAFKSKPSKKS